MRGNLFRREMATGNDGGTAHALHELFPGLQVRTGEAPRFPEKFCYVAACDHEVGREPMGRMILPDAPHIDINADAGLIRRGSSSIASGRQSRPPRLVLRAASP